MENLTVSFDGEGIVNVVPDEALLSLNVSARSLQSPQEAAALQANKARNLIAYLRNAKVPEGKVSTSNYQCGPVLRYDDVRRENVPTGEYVANQNFEVRVEKSVASQVSAAVVEWASLQQLTFVVSRELNKKKKEEATELAICDAEYRAKKRESRLGIRLGEVLGFTESSGGNHDRRYAAKSFALAGAEAMDCNAPELTAGETEVSTSVVITYKLR